MDRLPVDADELATDQHRKIEENMQGFAGHSVTAPLTVTYDPHLNEDELFLDHVVGRDQLEIGHGGIPLASAWLVRRNIPRPPSEDNRPWTEHLDPNTGLGSRPNKSLILSVLGVVVSHLCMAMSLPP